MERFTQAGLAFLLRTHKKANPYECTKCDRGFRAVSSVATHMRTHACEKLNRMDGLMNKAP